jgi:tetratricopeptide (TPR) repeat protein
MIVKNGGNDLRLCLQSVAGLVSQIVLADTGSTDNTLAIAKEFGATVVPFPWTNNFAEARNAALEPITTDWVLVLDADEELSPEAVSAIPALLRNSQGVGGYLLRIRNYLPERHVQFRSSTSVPNKDQIPRARHALSWAEHELCRLFKRDPAIRYMGRVHEVVEHAIVRSGLRVEHSELSILHFGQLANPEVHARKALLYRDLGRAKVEEEPRNAMAWFELGGIELSRFNNQPVAMQCLQTAVALEARLLDAWILLFYLHDSRGEYDLAFAVYSRLVAMNAMIPFNIVQRCGDYLHDRGQLDKARNCYRQALDQAAAYPDGSTQNDLWAVESKLGYTEVRLGLRNGLQKLTRAAAEAPAVKENHTRLIKAFLALDDLEPAADAAESAVASCRDMKLYLLAATLRIQLQQPSKARALLDQGRQHFSSSDDYERAASRLSGG